MIAQKELNSNNPQDQLTYHEVGIKKGLIQHLHIHFIHRTRKERRRRKKTDLNTFRDLPSLSFQLFAALAVVAAVVTAVVAAVVVAAVVAAVTADVVAAVVAADVDVDVLSSINE